VADDLIGGGDRDQRQARQPGRAGSQFVHQPGIRRVQAGRLARASEGCGRDGVDDCGVAGGLAPD